MVDMSALAGLASSLKAAGDLTKAVIDLRDAQMIQAKVIELQAVILAAQSSAMSAQQDQFTLIERVRFLEKQIADAEHWDTEAEKYELKQIDVHAFAYMRKPDTSSAEPPHWLCVNCFDHHRRKSVLQYEGRKKDDTRTSVHTCPMCRASVLTYYARQPSDPPYQRSDA